MDACLAGIPGMPPTVIAGMIVDYLSFPYDVPWHIIMGAESNVENYMNALLCTGASLTRAPEHKSAKTEPTFKELKAPVKQKTKKASTPKKKAVPKKSAAAESSDEEQAGEEAAFGPAPVSTTLSDME